MEKVWAPLRALEQALDSGVDDTELHHFREVFLDVTFKFALEKKSERMWNAQIYRQWDIQKGDSAKLTPAQCSFNIMHTKSLPEKAEGRTSGAEAFCTSWNNKIKMASSSGTTKVAYVDAVFTVHARLLTVTGYSALVQWPDENFEPPIFPSMYKFDAIVERRTTSENSRYGVAGIIDMVVHQHAPTGELSVRQLTGQVLLGGKSKLDLTLGKKDASGAQKTQPSQINMASCLEICSRRAQMYTGMTWANTRENAKMSIESAQRVRLKRPTCGITRV